MSLEIERHSKMALQKPQITEQKTSANWRHRRFLIGLIIFTIIWLIPAIWTLLLSIRTETSIQKNLLQIIPNPVTFENWAYILSSSRVIRWFFNSLLVAVVHTSAQLLVCSLAAYAFARIDFWGRRFIYPLALAGFMIPFEAIFIPVYLLFANLELHNTYWALIIPGIASSFGIFLLTQFFKGIPRELEEAAYMDGATRFGVYWRIIMPLSAPVLTTLAIFTFLGNWNSYLWPLVSATRPEMQTITVGLIKMTNQSSFLDFYGRNMAGAWLTALPILIFFFVFQRRIISGIAINSGIK